MIRSFQLLCLSMIFALSNSAHAMETWTDEAFIERAFKKVVLEDEFRAGTHPLSKWQTPIYYWVNHEVSDQAFHQELVEEHFEQLKLLTDLSIEPAQFEHDANFTVYFTNQSRWKALVSDKMGSEAARNTYHSLCIFGSAISPEDSSIVRSIVIIPVDLAREHGKLLSCVIEETTQALGLRNDSEQSYPSVFNDKTPENFLSPLDVVLIQLMYEPAIESGMTEEELTPLLRVMIEEYDYFGILSNAVNLANDAPLVRQYK